ncbi:MAG: hypothetical protein HQK89_02265 [Nitrospirae bacterium]|nr:hypothetical protein [Nitrospirota bacterium]
MGVTDETVPVGDTRVAASGTEFVGVNVAVTVAAALDESIHVPVPVQPAPDQPAKVEPLAAVAVNVVVID